MVVQYTRHDMSTTEMKEYPNDGKRIKASTIPCMPNYTTTSYYRIEQGNNNIEHVPPHGRKLWACYANES